MVPGFPGEGRFTIACINFLAPPLFDKTTPTNSIEHNSVISKDKTRDVQVVFSQILYLLNVS